MVELQLQLILQAELYRNLDFRFDSRLVYACGFEFPGFDGLGCCFVEGMEPRALKNLDAGRAAFGCDANAEQNDSLLAPSACGKGILRLGIFSVSRMRPGSCGRKDGCGILARLSRTGIAAVFSFHGQVGRRRSRGRPGRRGHRRLSDLRHRKEDGSGRWSRRGRDIL